MPRGAGRLSHALTQVCETPVGGCEESSHHPPPPPGGRAHRDTTPPPGQSRWRGAQSPPPPPTPPRVGPSPPPLPLPLPTRGTAVWPPPPPPPPARIGGRGVHHTHGWPICRVVGKPSCAPQAACEPQDRPSNQIKSNQIKSNPTPQREHPPFPAPPGGRVPKDTPTPTPRGTVNRTTSVHTNCGAQKLRQ